MTDQQHNDPLHGITLEMILNQLAEHYGWDELGRIIKSDVLIITRASVSLTFLRSPWARKVEDLSRYKRAPGTDRKAIERQEDVKKKAKGLIRTLSHLKRDADSGFPGLWYQPAMASPSRHICIASLLLIPQFR
jgi:uncharacterized protein (DUF2132 family)